ncbi:MAG: GspE/PulE family protein [Gammaproteobacteria bacterium]
MVVQKLRLGDLLLQQNVITAEQLESALEHHKKTGLRIGESIVALGFLSGKELLNFISQQLNVPLISLSNHHFDPDLIKLLPETYARRYHAIVLHKQDTGMQVGMVDPTDITAIDEITNALHMPVNIALVQQDELNRALDLVYRRTSDITNYASLLYNEMGGEKAILSSSPEQENAPVVRLVDAIFQDAVQVNASDIHIEPDMNVLRIRQRVDGVLNENIMNAKSIAPAITLRLKLMAGLNISEKRMPQDGRFSIKVRDKNLDIRLSTLPTQFGESVVMRLLDQSGGILNLEKIGMPAHHLDRFRKMIRLPRGLVLVTGPTGSGKTTTLYGALNEINVVGNKIITVEDPVEYYLPRVNQVQVSSKIDLTFARVLRTAMRQDPDIILVGEMRDEETAEIGLRAALTGHLVLSTIHANDAATSALRLLDLGVEGYLVASTLRGVLAQRLVRRICSFCKEEETLDAQGIAWVSSLNLKNPTNVFFRGKGCEQCNHTGYQGRIGIFEWLEITPEMGMALEEKNPSKFGVLAREFLGEGLLLHSGMALVKEGVTTVDEVQRVAGEM